MGKDTVRGVVSEYSSFLAASSGGSHWAGMLRDAASDPDDARLARTVLSFFGGMGSINDIVFSDRGAEEQQKNDEFRGRLYRVATARVRADDIKRTRAIIELEERLAQAWVKRDRRFIERLLAEEWTVTDPSGRILTKQQVLDETFSTTERRIDSMAVDDLKVRLFGDVAVVTGRTRASGSYQGQSASVVLRFTDVFVRRAGNEWHVVASQGTILAPHG